MARTRCAVRWKLPRSRERTTFCLFGGFRRRRKAAESQAHNGFSVVATPVDCATLTDLRCFADRVIWNGPDFRQGLLSISRDVTCARHMHARVLTDRVKGRLCDQLNPALCDSSRNGMVRLWKTPNNGRNLDHSDAKRNAAIAVKKGWCTGCWQSQRVSWAYILLGGSRIAIK